MAFHRSIIDRSVTRHAGVVMLPAKFRLRARLFSAFAAVVLFGGAAQAASVRQFSPQGLIDQQVRATAVFSADIVPLGRPDAASPFTVNCGGVKGTGRWGDGKSWSYALERPLQPGERCDFRLRSGLKAMNGEAVSGEQSYVFYAPGPWPRLVTPEPAGRLRKIRRF